MKKKLLINQKEYEVDVLKQDASGLVFSFAGRTWSFNSSMDDALFSIDNSGVQKRHGLFRVKRGNVTVAAIGTQTFKIEEATSRSAKSAQHGSNMLSPMPGKILKVFKNAGDKVEVGETILVMEAMKMEHAIKATNNGTIAQIVHGEGEQVQGGVLLVEMESDS